jgi:hypothetical protein
MKRLRILPEMCASTVWLFANSTWNMVPGNTEVIVPSISIVLSWLIRMGPRVGTGMTRGSDVCSSRKEQATLCQNSLRKTATQQNTSTVRIGPLLCVHRRRNARADFNGFQSSV